ncbi:MAG: hypothetical protein [Microvirus sp.]|nr:MAG: hypothetical protein [Microvirus sp.]
MARTHAAILREMAQTRSAGLKKELQERILQDLEEELAHMFRPMAQQQLPLEQRADPPNPPGAGGSNSPAPKGKG